MTARVPDLMVRRSDDLATAQRVVVMGLVEAHVVASAGSAAVVALPVHYCAVAVADRILAAGSGVAAPAHL
jgi:hypothetical protein